MTQTLNFKYWCPPGIYTWAIIYINDSVQANNVFDFIMYADETTLSITHEIVLRNTQTLDTESKLNSELANVSNKLQLNRLSLNVY